MAARLRKTHQDDVRAKIKTSQIINRLTDHGFGKVDLTPTQVSALSIVLKKALPDLSAVELTGAEGGPIETKAVDYTNAPDDVVRWIASRSADAGADNGGEVRASPPPPDRLH